MPYDEGLAQRIRELLENRSDVSEKKMFGGLAFLVSGNMCVGVIGDELMVRVGPDAYGEAVRQPYARKMDFTGRPMKGFVYVGCEGIESDANLRRWAARGVDFASSLPAKKPGARSSGKSRRPLLAFMAILAVCVGCDHASKQAAVSLLADSAGLELAGGMLRLQLASNPGAFMSLGAGLPEALRGYLFMGMIPLLIAFVCVYFARSARASRGRLAALAILCGGGLGNWLDRVLHGGAVTDFVSLGFGRFRTGIFNFADLAIVAGIFWLISATRQREVPRPGQIS